MDTTATNRINLEKDTDRQDILCTYTQCCTTSPNKLQLSHLYATAAAAKMNRPKKMTGQSFASTEPPKKSYINCVSLKKHKRTKTPSFVVKPYRGNFAQTYI